jgi:hypothetical protein
MCATRQHWTARPKGFVLCATESFQQLQVQVSQEHQMLENSRSTLLEQVEHVRSELTAAYRALSERESAADYAEQQALALERKAKALQAEAESKEYAARVGAMLT